ncbi:element excision factor XisH family protein [Microcoleus sp. herbarium12]|jgi:XisH protein|uniref:element excision factor XisH family protein n=1 Tax=Microcoleus sp. herbarium12 TaxID=3055437 RepID=UPI002FCF4B9F
MPRLDLYHSVVKAALIKDGWRITDDPLQLQYEGFNLYADLGAERPVFAERRAEKIAVEIKGFGSPSPISELEKAVGQYALYRFLLQRIQPERLLYLAIPNDIYQDFFQRSPIRDFVTEQQVLLFIFNPNGEEIMQWIN